MKVDYSINHSSLLGKHRPKYGLESISNNESMCVGMSNNVNRGYNSGSSVSFGSAADFSLKTLNKINTLCQKHKTIAQNLVALVLAVGFRPLAIMSLPGKKDKDDKIYASGHAMASGIIGFVFSTIVMYPLGIAAQKLGKESAIIQKRLLNAKAEGKHLSKGEILKDMKFLNEKFLNIFGKFTKDGKIIKLNEKMLDKTLGILEMAPDTFVFGIAKAMLTVALIPPILKHVFGVEKKKKPEQNQSPKISNDNQPETKDLTKSENVQNNKLSLLKKPEIQRFVGGEK